jgi:hypothetical protein
MPDSACLTVSSVSLNFSAALRRVAADLQAQFLELLLQFLDAGAALVQERDQLDAGLAEDLHGQRRLLRAIRHGGEGVGQIEQHRLGRANLAGGILHRNAEATEGFNLLLGTTRRLDHRGGQLLHALGQALQRNAGLLGDGFQQ